MPFKKIQLDGDVVKEAQSLKLGTLYITVSLICHLYLLTTDYQIPFNKTVKTIFSSANFAFRIP